MWCNRFIGACCVGSIRVCCVGRFLVKKRVDSMSQSRHNRSDTLVHPPAAPAQHDHIMLLLPTLGQAGISLLHREAVWHQYLTADVQSSDFKQAQQIQASTLAAVLHPSCNSQECRQPEFLRSCRLLTVNTTIHQQLKQPMLRPVHGIEAISEPDRTTTLTG